MGVVSMVKRLVNGVEESIPQQTQVQRKHSNDDGYYSKGNWWESENDYTDAEMKEIEFDTYAKVYYSMDATEQQIFLHGKDRFNLMD